MSQGKIYTPHFSLSLLPHQKKKPKKQKKTQEVAGRVAVRKEKGSFWLVVFNWLSDLDWPLPPLPVELAQTFLKSSLGRPAPPPHLHPLRLHPPPPGAWLSLARGGESDLEGGRV